jgi:hypothetical protein
MLLFAMLNKRAGSLLMISMWRKVVFICILLVCQLVLITVLPHTKLRAESSQTETGDVGARSWTGGVVGNNVVVPVSTVKE